MSFATAVIVAAMVVTAAAEAARRIAIAVKEWRGAIHHSRPTSSQLPAIERAASAQISTRAARWKILRACLLFAASTGCMAALLWEALAGPESPPTHRGVAQLILLGAFAVVFSLSPASD